MLVRRTWKQRLFSRPWRPLQAFREEAEPLAVTLPSEATVRPFTPYRAPETRYPTRHLEAVRRRTGPIPRTLVAAPRPTQRAEDDEEDADSALSTPWISGNSSPVVEPDRFASGGGGTFDGGGASAHSVEPWPDTRPESPAIEAAPGPADEAAPSPAPEPDEAPAHSDPPSDSAGDTPSSDTTSTTSD